MFVSLNLKDIVVSFYHHCHNASLKYNGSWNDFLEFFMSSDTGNEYQLQVSEIFKEAIVVIKIHNLKTDRQYNGQKKRGELVSDLFYPSYIMAKRKGAS